MNRRFFFDRISSSVLQGSLVLGVVCDFGVFLKFRIFDKDGLSVGTILSVARFCIVGS